MVSSFLSYILGTGSFFFLVPTLFLLLCLFFYTLYTAPLLSLPSLLLSLSNSMLSGIGYTICFSLVFWERILVLSFYGFEPLCLHISHSPHTLLLSLLSTILSQAEVCLLEACSLSHNIPVHFPMWNVLVFSCCTFCGLAIHTIFFLLFFSFSAIIFGHSHL